MRECHLYDRHEMRHVCRPRHANSMDYETWVSTLPRKVYMDTDETLEAKIARMEARREQSKVKTGTQKILDYRLEMGHGRGNTKPQKVRVK